MNIIDLVVIGILLLGVWDGWSNGLVKSLCSFAGFFMGLVIAYMFYSVVGDALAPHLGKNAGIAPILAFLLIWIAVPVALNFGGTFLNKFFSKILPGVVNGAGGAAVTSFKFMLGATLVLYVLLMMKLVDQETIDSSFLGSKMIALADQLMEKFRDGEITIKPA